MDTDREQQVNNARHSQVFSGGDISELARNLSRDYIEGTTTLAEIRIRILERYGDQEYPIGQIPDL